MSEPRSRSGGARSLLAVSVSLCVLAASASTLAAEVSEIESFQRAVESQSKQDALAFIKTYPSSHLAPDLIELLWPEIAQQVCADLGGSAPAKVLLACDLQRQRPGPHEVVRQLLERERELENQLKKLKEQRGPHVTLIAS